MTPKEIAKQKDERIKELEAQSGNWESAYELSQKRIKELEEVMKTTLADSDCVNNVTNLSVFNRQVIENCLN